VALLDRTRAVPGVDAAALVSALPFAGGTVNGVMDVEAHPRAPGAPWKTVAGSALTPGALRALGVPLLAGRDFTDADRAGGAPVALVDAAAARVLAGVRRRAPGARPARAPAQPRAPWVTVVGVVGDVRRDSLPAAPAPSLYMPLAQDFPQPVRVVARGTAGEAELAPALRSALAALDPSVPLGKVRTLGALVGESAARQRLVARLLEAFAAAAVGLGAVGVYGVIAFAVARRTRELGVRARWAPRRRRCGRMVLGRGGRLALVGLGIGLAARSRPPARRAPGSTASRPPSRRCSPAWPCCWAP
jgi:hypothetical protein